jgi:hypothetical protein
MLSMILAVPAVALLAQGPPSNEPCAPSAPGPENAVFHESGSELILCVDYESGDLTTAGEGVLADLPAAHDAISISDDMPRRGRFCVRTKVANSDDFLSYGKHRAETTVMKKMAIRYSESEVFRYRFSLRLDKSWQIEGKLPDDRDSVDIVWQFKRFEGGPDMFIGVKREEIVLRSQNGKQVTILGSYAPDEWMDFCVISRWSAGEDGFTEVFVKRPADREFRSAASVRGPNMRDAEPKNAYLTWGIYKPGMSNSTATNARIVFHDDIIVEKMIRGELPPP